MPPPARRSAVETGATRAAASAGAGTAPALRIVPLTLADAPAYRRLMLEAYEQAEDAFTSTRAEREAEPLAWWEKRIAPAGGLGQAFGAWAGDALVGSVALEYSAKPKTRHSALLIGMYVRPALQRRGVGRRLVQAAIAAAQARGGISALQLTVTEGNAPAIALYASLGFHTWGVEPQALRTAGGMRQRAYMWRPIDPPGTDGIGG